MNLQCVNGELIDMDAPVYATTASNTTIPVVKHSLTTESPSAGLSKAEFFTLIDAAYRNDEPRDLYMAREAYRALAQRLREVDERLSTVIRVSQEYADEAAQAQRRLAQLEAQDKARS